MKKIILLSIAAGSILAASAQQPATKVQVRANAPTTSAWYMPPLTCLYQGIDKMANASLTPCIEVHPAGEYLYWENLSDGTSTWQYFDIATGEMAVSSTSDLSLEFPFASLSAYSASETMKANGMLVPPVEVMAGNESFASCSLMQIGGAGILETTNPETGKKEAHYNGMLPFSVAKDGLMVYTQGDNVPVFGYSPDSQDWLSNYVFQGAPDPGEYVYCNGIYNTVIATEIPLTVRGAHFFAYGKLHSDAVLTFEIYPTTEEGEVIYTPLATATCSVSEMNAIPDGDMFIYEIPFTLDKEVELTANVSPYYLVGITGFYQAADWFAPYQSEKPNEYELALAYYRCTASINNTLDDWYIWHVANFTNAEGEDLYSCFAICLDAAYPWIEDPWTSGIQSVLADKAEANGNFDLMGRPVDKNYKGIVIENGKLVYRK